MPGMDGLTLARTIRAEERQRGETSPVPILAWTANVMAEDVDAALDAGMNDVLAKPSALAMVQRALEAWLTRTAGHSASLPEVAPATPAVRPDVAPIDEEELRMIMNGDGRLTREILDGFRASGGREIASLERALADANAPEIRRIAHRLKGQARLVAAAGLAGACERIEHHAIAGAVDRAAAAQAAAEWESLKRYLDARPG
jgi:HPt (histidine-containing phosphotransfer) domain-containing protein